MIINNIEDMETLQAACEMAARHHKKLLANLAKARNPKRKDPVLEKKIAFQTDRVIRNNKIADAAYIQIQIESVHQKAAS